MKRSKIVAFLRSFFGPPKRDLKKIVPQLEKLQKQIKNVASMPNSVGAIVRLFQIISPLQDVGGFSQTMFILQAKNHGQLDKIIGALNALQKHFENAGRCEYGMNRTQKGQPITPDDVWLGNVYGIWTNTAQYWLERQEELEKQFRLDLSKDPKNPVTTWYCINNYQAGRFVKSHTDGILENIKILLAA
ncbi:hypothetical protein KJ991_02185 [Patescibacteria group bacterium]|nr:hypothetical protein [Patescibacteria group bacterium]MBU4057693.1 hypothetical protein [Patescibacteria group bacterium]MBU4115650.1 hypothetical protein [Patescibacteria group bacterium]